MGIDRLARPRRVVTDHASAMRISLPEISKPKFPFMPRRSPKLRLDEKTILNGTKIKPEPEDVYQNPADFVGNCSENEYAR